MISLLVWTWKAEVCDSEAKYSQQHSGVRYSDHYCKYIHCTSIQNKRRKQVLFISLNCRFKCLAHAKSLQHSNSVPQKEIKKSKKHPNWEKVPKITQKELKKAPKLRKSPRSPKRKLTRHQNRERVPQITQKELKKAPKLRKKHPKITQKELEKAPKTETSSKNNIIETKSIVENEQKFSPKIKFESK